MLGKEESVEDIPYTVAGRPRDPHRMLVKKQRPSTWGPDSGKCKGPERDGLADLNTSHSRTEFQNSHHLLGKAVRGKAQSRICYWNVSKVYTPLWEAFHVCSWSKLDHFCEEAAQGIMSWVASGRCLQTPGMVVNRQESRKEGQLCLSCCFLLLKVLTGTKVRAGLTLNEQSRKVLMTEGEIRRIKKECPGKKNINRTTL